MQPWVLSQHHITQAWCLMHACNPSTWEVKAKGWGAPGFPQLHIQFKTSLGYRRSIPS
ncbi:hypothetical protein I79_012466 [Cricetulus griseus]|uniref:Uncharacterized protein n=1 Tax=Cricetulus griseus TaxID=10029 RepID=G3HNW9_CRIGR|nr:hypothetical protein I79_012466 [Cricetulus griseus]